MKKEARFTFSEPVYEFTITVIVTNDVSQWSSKYRDEFQPRPGEIEGQCQAFHVGEGKRCLIVIQPNSPLSDIAHEIGHAARYVLNHIGFKITAENDEPLAYYEDFLTRVIHNRIRLLKKPRKFLDKKKKCA